jgi:putative endonuclease
VKSYRQALGRRGEDLAASFLSELGYEVLERNARSPYGEIDLIVQRQDLTVFVEVKSRTSTTYGLPEEAITPLKQAHLLAAIQAYLQAHPDLNGDWRIDVIAIQYPGHGAPPQITHFENAIP